MNLDFKGFWKTTNGFEADVVRQFGKMWFGFIWVPTYSVGKDEYRLKIFTAWDSDGRHFSDSLLDLRDRLHEIQEEMKRHESIDLPEFSSEPL